MKRKRRIPNCDPIGLAPFLRSAPSSARSRSGAYIHKNRSEVTPRQIARAVFDLVAAERARAVTPGIADMSAADSARILDGVVGRMEGAPKQLAGLLPKYVDFPCADDGTMWLTPLDLERGAMRGGLR